MIIKYPNLKNILTPSPEIDMTSEQHDNLVFLLQNGVSARDIFIDYNYPLEWAVAVEEELKPVTEPETPIE